MIKDTVWNTRRFFFGVNNDGSWGLIQGTSSPMLYECVPRDVVERLLPGDYEEDVDRELGREYEDDKGHFRIEFPVSWDIRESSMEGTLIKCVHKGDEQNLSVIAIAKEPDIGYENIWSVSRDEMTESVLYDMSEANPVVQDYQKILLNGVNASRTTISANLMDNSLKMVVYHVIHNGALYRVSGSAKGEQGYIEDMLQVMDKSMLTFEIITK